MTIDFSGFNLTQKGGGGVQPASKWTISSINMFSNTYKPDEGETYKDIDYDLSSIFTNENAQYECIVKFELNYGNCHLKTTNNNLEVSWAGSTCVSGFSRGQATIVITDQKSIKLRVYSETSVLNCTLVAYREII